MAVSVWVIQCASIVYAHRDISTNYWLYIGHRNGSAFVCVHLSIFTHVQTLYLCRERPDQETY